MVMRLALAFLVGCALLPGVASAATVGGRTNSNSGATFGTMHYRAGHGVANRVTVESITPYGEFRITDRAERLRARGECKQAGRHSAICPWSESGYAVVIVVGNRSDRVAIAGRVSALVRGGDGDDLLSGNGVELVGGRGDDSLRGGRDWDRLHGGPGRDRVDGGGGSQYLADRFFDDETDAQAARDVFVGGRNARAEIVYSKRARALRIDLHDARIAPEGDLIRDVKSVTGGSGADVLIGTGGTNALAGGPGNDRLDGRGGDDRIDGDGGDDVMAGGGGDDRIGESVYADPTARRGDRFVGGGGADEISSLDTLRADGRQPDDVRCDSRDRPVTSDPADRLRGCAQVSGWDIAELELRVQPKLTEDGAAFRLRCAPTESEQVDESTFIQRCRGRLSVRSAGGDAYGSRDFTFVLEDSRSPEMTVTVPLTAAGRAALEKGAVVDVEAEAFSSNGWSFQPAGYRASVDA
jgi:hypothetical protein